MNQWNLSLQCMMLAQDLVPTCCSSQIEGKTAPGTLRGVGESIAWGGGHLALAAAPPCSCLNLIWVAPPVRSLIVAPPYISWMPALACCCSPGLTLSTPRHPRVSLINYLCNIVNKLASNRPFVLLSVSFIKVQSQSWQRIDQKHYTMKSKGYQN